MKFELLSLNYLSQLVEFENENRQWFELFIESRGENFYSQQSIKKHLNDFIEQYHLDKSYPGVVILNNKIIGRANLKNICLSSKTAEVGYRVAKSYVGSGVASFALRELIEISKKKYTLNDLKAFVLENNPASAKVLEKQSFIQVRKINQYYNLLGNDLSCTEYRLTIS